MHDQESHEHRARENDAAFRYWQRSLILVMALLAVWFAASFGCGILFRDALDAWTLPGTHFPLGFWFAQQGAILVFVVLIGAYVLIASRIDRSLEDERHLGDTGATPRNDGPQAPSGEGHQ